MATEMSADEQAVNWLRRKGGYRIVAVYLISITVLLIVSLVLLWPTEYSTLTLYQTVNPDTTVGVEIRVPDTTRAFSGVIRIDSSAVGGPTRIDTVSFQPTYAADPISGVRLLLLILLVGALGASLHGLTSLAEYVGNRDFETSWTTWYMLRPFVGAILAAVFYFVIRAGLFGEGGLQDPEDLYVVMALAGLIGLFSKQALYKLSELFTVLFRTAPRHGDEKLKDSLVGETVVVITGATPTSGTVGQPGEVSLIGTGFTEKSVVQINGVERKATFVSPTELKLALSEEDVAKPGPLQVTVFNQKADGSAGAVSKPLVFDIVGAAPDVSDDAGEVDDGASAPGATPTVGTAPAPTLKTLEPPAVDVGHEQVITVTGEGFTQATAVHLDGSPRPTTFVSATELTFALHGADVAHPARYQVTVAAPGSAASQPLALTVSPPDSGVTRAPTRVVEEGSMGSEGAITPGPDDDDGA